MRQVVRGADDGGFVRQPLVLAEIEAAENDHHAQLVGPVENAFEPAQAIRAQRAVGVDG